LLLATNNRGKVKEYLTLLRELPLDLVTPAEVGIQTSVEETGTTFAANARLKAETMARESRLVSLADDSGLEVDALDGEPGVRSARYAGEKASDAERVDCLLGKMAGVPREKRTARFVCVIAVATPEGEVAFCTGECRGIITEEPKGDLGFGYDPVFYFPEWGRTMAELPMAAKNRVSHRGRAARQVGEMLRGMGLI
jgi:XTP/dITP diphosphohydrolase